MPQYLELILTLLGLFLIVPITSAIGARKWSAFKEAAIGFGTVMMLLVVIPMVIGCLIALIMWPFIS